MAFETDSIEQVPSHRGRMGFDSDSSLSIAQVGLIQRKRFIRKTDVYRFLEILSVFACLKEKMRLNATIILRSLWPLWRCQTICSNKQAHLMCPRTCLHLRVGVRYGDQRASADQLRG